MVVLHYGQQRCEDVLPAFSNHSESREQFRTGILLLMLHSTSTVKKKKSRYECSQLTAGKLSCSIKALHQYPDPLIQEACLSSLTGVQRVILFPSSLRRWPADASSTPKVSTYAINMVQRSNGHRGQRTSPPCRKLPNLLLHRPHE